MRMCVPNTKLYLSAFVFFMVSCLASITLDDFIENPTGTQPSRRWAQDEVRVVHYIQHLEKRCKGIHAFGKLIDLKRIRNTDCLNLPFFVTLFLHTIVTPSKNITVKFYLSNRENRRRSRLLTSAQLEKTRDVVLIIHGFMSSSKMAWVHHLTNSLLHKADVNVIAVDWSAGKASWAYWDAVGTTRAVGRQTSRFLMELLNNDFSPSQVRCIGHSLGAHICSYASRAVGAFGRITGLDPAQPCFKGHGLSASDATYIDVVHTNTKLFGRNRTIGTHDFYPNGGRTQPGCRLKPWFTSALSPCLKQYANITEIQQFICSHGRSYDYYIDALNNDSCQFWGHKWNFKTNRTRTYQRPCTVRTCAPMGLDSAAYPGRGAYYFATHKHSPFCIPESNNLPKLLQRYST